MISAKKSNGVKNTTNNMYKKQITFVEIALSTLFITLHSLNIMESLENRFTSQVLENRWHFYH
jgi:hypothetical protein